jgi:hypothetical protein
MLNITAPLRLLRRYPSSQRQFGFIFLRGLESIYVIIPVNLIIKENI